jgi:flavodoxin
LENNSATKALIEKLKQWDIVVNAHEYWNFEKVWDLGFSLPTEDSQITTQAWDLVLYQWNQISLFYESNSWSYTKLWKIQNKSESELKQILWNWDVTLTFSLWNFEAEEENKSLVLYFSPTWNTKRIATFISEITSGDITEIIPEIPYTAEDLDYNTNGTRANNEQNDPDARPEIATEFSLDGYDRIYIGYPIWWWTNPKIILTLIEKYDFSGKEIVLFCTSWSSGIGTSESELRGHGLNIIWSKRFAQGASKQEVQEWLESL